MTIQNIFTEQDVDPTSLDSRRADLKRLRRIWEQDDLEDEEIDDIDLLVCENSEDYLDPYEQMFVDKLEEKFGSGKPPVPADEACPEIESWMAVAANDLRPEPIKESRSKAICWMALAATIIVSFGVLSQQNSSDAAVVAIKGVAQMAAVELPEDDANREAPYSDIYLNSKSKYDEFEGVKSQYTNLNSAKKSFSDLFDFKSTMIIDQKKTRMVYPYEYADFSSKEKYKNDYYLVERDMVWVSSQISKSHRISKFSVEVNEETKTFSEAGNLLGSDSYKDISGYIMEVLPIIEKNSNIITDRLKYGDFLQAVVRIENNSVFVEQLYIRHRGVDYRYQGGVWKDIQQPSKNLVGENALYSAVDLEDHRCTVENFFCSNFNAVSKNGRIDDVKKTASMAKSYLSGVHSRIY